MTNKKKQKRSVLQDLIYDQTDTISKNACQQELDYYIQVLRNARPFVNDMVGIASSARIVIAQIDDILQSFPEKS